MRRERHNFFNKRAAHFGDPHWSCFGKTKNHLPCSIVESQLTQPTRGARSAQSRLVSPRSESQLTRLEFKSQLYQRVGIP